MLCWDMAAEGDVYRPQQRCAACSACPEASWLPQSNGTCGRWPLAQSDVLPLPLPPAAGATVGKMPCLAISASVTAYGRQMIMHTREMVTSRFCRANGYEADCDVIYGDTDSVMVNFRVRGWREGWECR